MPLPYSLPFTFGGSETDEVADLVRLLPPGAAFLQESGSVVWNFLLALSGEFGRIRDRAQDLLLEMDPRTATETLGDWEQAVGLPDEVVVQIPSAMAARRLAIAQKLVRSGGQTPAFYVSLAAACGYSVTVTEWGSSVLRAGFRAGARCFNTDWAFTWQVTVSPPAGIALTHAQLEGAIRKAAPAHTIVFFIYL